MNHIRFPRALQLSFEATYAILKSLRGILKGSLVNLPGFRYNLLTILRDIQLFENFGSLLFRFGQASACEDSR